MRQMLTELEEIVDIVIVDSPPATIVSDTAILSAVCDGVLLVFRAKTTRRDVAKNAVNTLIQVQANIIGVVLNGIAVNAAGYGYNYGYNNSYSYSHNAVKAKHDSGRKAKRKIRDSRVRPQYNGGIPAQYTLNAPNQNAPNQNSPKWTRQTVFSTNRRIFDKQVSDSRCQISVGRNDSSPNWSYLGLLVSFPLRVY